MQKPRRQCDAHGKTICIAQVKLAVVFACCLTRQSSLRLAKSRQESTSARQFLTCRLDSVAENTWVGGGRGGIKSEKKKGGGGNAACCDVVSFHSVRNTNTTGVRFPRGSTFCSRGLCVACVPREYLHEEACWRQSPL